MKQISFSKESPERTEIIYTDGTVTLRYLKEDLWKISYPPIWDEINIDPFEYGKKIVAIYDWDKIRETLEAE